MGPIRARGPRRGRPAAALSALLGLALTVAAAAARAGDERVIVALGDSLTAGFGLAPEEAWPALIEARLRREGYPYRVVNAGVSGDTTAGGLRRVDWVLRHRPEVAVVALGANDGLRGQPVDAMRANLVALVERLQGAGVRVLLAGMEVPPNYGAAYARAFRAAFPEVARRTGAALMPFLLDGVAADPRLNLPDGLHPNAAGQRVIAERLWPHLRPLLRR
jgi:acyl-CoA thioesterase-1